jgi:hypothetical protein
MEQIELTYPAKRKDPEGAHVGVVGSGDLEVLLEPAEGEILPFLFGPVLTAFETLGKRYWTDSSRSMTELPAFRSTTQEQHPATSCCASSRQLRRVSNEQSKVARSSSSTGRVS